MGDAQSAQRETNKDAEAEEESGKVDDAPAEPNAEEKPLRISEINGKADSTIAGINGHCEEITAEAIPSPDKDVSGTAKQIKDEETPLKSVDINDEEPRLEIIEMDAKQNDINDSFQRFFSNISLKLSVKRGSVEKDHIAIDVSDKTNKNESNRPEDINETVKEAERDDAEQSIDPNIQGTNDNDSTTCPTLTDVTSEDIPENVQDKTAETKEETESDNVDTATTSPEDEIVQQDVMCEDLNPAPTSSPETEEVVSPVKRFFTTGIFSGLRKKKKSIEDETVVRELVAMGKGTAQTKEKSKDLQQDNERNPVDTEGTTVETENKEKGHVEENIWAVSASMMDEGEAPTTNSATVTGNEPENTGSQDIVQDSPLKRLLSGSSLRKVSKKQRGRKSSHEKLSDSGEHIDQLKTSAKPAETPKEQSPTQHSGEEDGAWASFKKLLTPKKHMKRPSLTNGEIQIAGSVGETKPSEGETISENGTEEGKKRKDSSVSWEAVLCGSGKKSRSRKTSDSEEETPQTEDGNKKETMLLESSNELHEITAISPKQAGSPSEGDGVSTWKSFKKLVTPKRKAKDEEESKDNIQSDSEVTWEEPSFSIKKFLPGRRKKKTVENQDQVSSDEADKEVASGDEDSETPAVVPLSEFDTSETEVHIETQADVESHVPKEADYELEKELLDQLAKPVMPSDSLQTEANKVQANKENLKNEAPAVPASNEEPEDLTELFSKHHQLSDIPEEGIITDTIATPASIAEEAARDDTIMEDLIEITSEAITAPEPIDETEMISAVSQLSESSNTSGNITPVPVEYDIKHTGALLQQVVETISISPKSEPVYSEEIKSERIVSSVSNRILETFVKRESTILEIHKRADTASNAEELDITEHSATAQTESISESLSREIVSEAPTEEFVTAAEVSVSYPEDSIIKSVSTSESKPLVKRQCEINETVSIETLPEVDSIVADKGCLIGTQQDEKEPLEVDTQEAELAAIIAECEDGGEKKEDQTPTQKEKQSLPHITDQDQVENKDQHQVKVEKLQDLQAVQDASSGSEECGDQLLEKEVVSVESTAEETIADEPTEESVALTEYNVDAKTEKLQAEVLQAVQTATINLEEGNVQLLEKEMISGASPAEETLTEKSREASDAAQAEHFEGKVLEDVQTDKLNFEKDGGQLFEKEVTLQAQVTVTQKPKEEIRPLNEYDVKERIENRLQTEAAQTAHVGKPEVLEAVQTATFSFEENSVHLLSKGVISEDIPAEETERVIDKPKEKIEPLTEYNVAAETENKHQKDAAQMEHTEEPEELQAVQTAAINLEEGSVQLLEKEVISEDSPAEETLTDKSKEASEFVTKYTDAEKTDMIQSDAAQAEHLERKVLEAVQTTTFDLKEDSTQLLENEVTKETVTEKPEEETEPLIELDVKAEMENQIQANGIEHAEEQDVLETAPTTRPNLEENCGHLLETKDLLEDILANKTVTDQNQPKEETGPFAEYDEETEKKMKTNAAQTKHVKETEVLEVVQTATLNLEKVSGQMLEKELSLGDISAQETVPDKQKEGIQSLTEYDIAAKTENKFQRDAAQTLYTKDPEVLEDKQKEETQPLTEYNVKEGIENRLQTDAAQTEQVLEAVQTAKLNLEKDSGQVLEKEVTLQDIQAQETVTQKPKEVLEAVQTATFSFEKDSVHLLSKEVISEDIPAEETETVIDKPKEKIELLTEFNVAAETENKHQKDAAQMEHTGEPEVLEDVQTDTLDIEEGNLQTFNESEIPQAIPAAETFANVLSEKTLETEAVEVSELVVASEFKYVQDHEVVEDAILGLADGSVQSHDKEVISGEIPPADTFTHELTQATEGNVEAEQSAEDATGHIQVSPSNETEIKTVTEVESSMAAHIVSENVEEGSAYVLKVNENQKRESTPQNAQVSQEDHISEVVDELQTVTAVPASSADEESCVQVREKPVFSETATPLVKNDATMTEEDSSVVLINVPLVGFKDNHQNQVQVVDVDIKSAEKTVDTALEVGITEGKEVIDVCQKSVKEVDKLSAKSETEETLIHEENMVIIQEITQHVVSESVLVKLEQEVIKQTDVVTDISGLEEQNVIEDTTVWERPEEVSAVSSDGSATGEQVFKDDSFTNDKENSEDPKTEMEKSKVDVTTEEVKLVSDVKEMNQETQITQIAQSHTGIISLINNVESSSTLSLEFKVNIQLGQGKEPASPPPTTETTEPVKKTDVSQVGIQAVGPEKEPGEKQKMTQLVDVAVQGTEITALEPANVDQTEGPVITKQPQLLYVGMQTVVTVEPAEQIKPTEVKETTEEIKKETREVFLSHPGVAEICGQETKEEQPVKHSEEEADQDVWMDAEEDVNFLEETELSLHETDEPPEHRHESNQEEISAIEPDFEMAPTSIVEEEGNQQMFKQTKRFESESEGEDFAVALEHSETVTASTAIMEWD